MNMDKMLDEMSRDLTRQLAPLSQPRSTLAELEAAAKAIDEVADALAALVTALTGTCPTISREPAQPSPSGILPQVVFLSRRIGTAQGGMLRLIEHARREL